MRVEVLMASGDTERWPGADASTEDGYLTVVTKLQEEPTDDMKLISVTTEREQEYQFQNPPGKLVPAPPKATLTELYKVLAVYAPGMWIRVVFDE